MATVLVHQNPFYRPFEYPRTPNWANIFQWHQPHHLHVVPWRLSLPSDSALPTLSVGSPSWKFRHRLKLLSSYYSQSVNVKSTLVTLVVDCIAKIKRFSL